MTNLTQHSWRSSSNEALRLAQGVRGMTFLPIKFVLVIGFICGHPPIAVAAEEPAGSTAQPMPEERFAIHGQVTYVEQETGSFTSPYSGPNSLSPSIGRET